MWLAVSPAERRASFFAGVRDADPAIGPRLSTGGQPIDPIELAIGWIELAIGWIVEPIELLIVAKLGTISVKISAKGTTRRTCRTGPVFGPDIVTPDGICIIIVILPVTGGVGPLGAR